MSFNVNAIAQHLRILSRPPDVRTLLHQTGAKSEIDRRQYHDGANIFPSAKEMRRPILDSVPVYLHLACERSKHQVEVSYHKPCAQTALPAVSTAHSASCARSARSGETGIGDSPSFRTFVAERVLIPGRPAGPNRLRSEIARAQSVASAAPLVPRMRLTNHSASIAFAKAGSPRRGSTRTYCFQFGETTEPGRHRVISRQLSNQFWATRNQRLGLDLSAAGQNQSVIKQTVPDRETVSPPR